MKTEFEMMVFAFGIYLEEEEDLSLMNYRDDDFLRDERQVRRSLKDVLEYLN